MGFAGRTYHPPYLTTPEHDDIKSGALHPIGRHGSAGAAISDVEVSGGPSGIRTLDRRIKKSVAPASKLRGKRRPQATYRPKAHTYVSVAPVRALTATMGGAVNPTAINFLSR